LGGVLNTILASEAFIGGGALNRIDPQAGDSAIVGGLHNVVRTNANLAALGGGEWNLITGKYGVIPGGYGNTAGDWSFAAGRRAKATRAGSFVWGDSTDADITAVSSNSVTMRASGGYLLYTDSALTAGVNLWAGDNSWQMLSDRDVKENFRPIDPRAILEAVVALPVTEWNLMSQSPEIRHLGPMAQDFKAAFGLGVDDRHISTSDAVGVVLAAIQGLHQNVESGKLRTESRIEKLEAENAELKARLQKLEALLTKENGGGK
jgi:hypothetical protein